MEPEELLIHAMVTLRQHPEQVREIAVALKAMALARPMFPSKAVFDACAIVLTGHYTGMIECPSPIE